MLEFSGYSLLISKKLQFLKSFTRQRFDTNHFKGFSVLSQKLVPTVSIKNLQNVKNVIFECSEH